jgi:hypothetical protein
MAKNTGKYKQSAEAKRSQKMFCSDLRDMFRLHGKEGDKKFLAGDREGAYQEWTSAGAVFADAKHAGCKWAQ